MPAPSASTAPETDFDPQTGRPVPVAPSIVRITAPNASAYTFTGTNSYLLGKSRVAVIDPGPEDADHLAALLAAIDGRPVQAIILTHTHRDHCGLARDLCAATGAPLLSGGPHRLSRPLKRFEFNPLRRSGDFSLEPDRTLAHGDTIEVDGVGLKVVATPGHCDNHLAFAVTDRAEIFVGDHIMGWNSTGLTVPDGNLGDYLASIDTLLGLPQTRYLSGHGAEMDNGPARARALRDHRLMRNGQLLSALAQGPQSLRAVTRAIYPNVSGRVAIAARGTLLAHAEYLAQQGRIAIHRGLLGVRLAAL